MKKLLVICICALLTISLAACQGSAGSTSSTAPQGSATEPEERPDEAPVPAEDGNRAISTGTPSTAAVDAILSAYSAKEFAEGEVAEEDLRLILESGLKAPSARNLQPWHFTVITDSGLLGQVLREPPAGGVAIVISGTAEELEGVNVDFDCGLATQNMYVAAQSLGYGAHIYMGGVSELNGDLREDAGIPEGFDAIVVMLVAVESPDVDAVSSASTRSPLDEVVTFVQ